VDKLTESIDLCGQDSFHAAILNENIVFFNFNIVLLKNFDHIFGLIEVSKYLLKSLWDKSSEYRISEHLSDEVMSETSCVG
jgi:hypothetical protein